MLGTSITHSYILYTEHMSLEESNGRNAELVMDVIPNNNLSDIIIKDAPGIQ